MPGSERTVTGSTSLGSIEFQRNYLMFALRFNSYDSTYLRDILRDARIVGAVIDDSTAWTPLHFCAHWGHLNILLMMLNGAVGETLDINIRTQEGCTPLWLSVMSGSVRCVQLLLDHGADPDAEDRIGMTPLMGACIEDNRVLVSVLAPVSETVATAVFFDPKKETSETALCLAVRNHSVDNVRVLLDHGASDNVPSMVKNYWKCRADFAVMNAGSLRSLSLYELRERIHRIMDMLHARIPLSSQS